MITRKNTTHKNVKVKRLDFAITSVKSAGADCIIEGYANTSDKDRVGDVVMPTAFEKSLPTYLKNPILLANHNWEDIVGRVTDARITDKGLYIKARISDTRPDIKTLINEKCLSTFSIGYNEVDADYDDATKTKYIKELELLEISVVSVPANTEASFTEVNTKDENAPAATEKPVTEAEPKAAKRPTFVEYVSIIKEVINQDLGENGAFAVSEYFHSHEELMTKQELLEILKQKSIPAKADAKADGPAADGANAAPAAQAADDDAKLDQQILDKLNALAEAVASLMEKEDAEEGSADDKPAPEAPAKGNDAEPAPKDKPENEDAQIQEHECPKCGYAGEMKAKKPNEEPKDKPADGDMSEEDVEKSLADIEVELDSLDEKVNG